ncbi:Dynein light chain Tctex-type 1 [Monoraphidium neglectum]|uniref:Dynein light chain Tctex-type 1 n=1 Tax=Monoraphidium neglectum TaxID=145388 RepID=A0A0D2MTS7_9CHLO|nr:Dynein light chain Tctex-type 1 [Monoraphidium neglectum]KIZ03887.1 Dynein light chain Tctex-type 1 [Monoraphidium neglectum]|eukprot:XP_013902906.1 Dynein light chain Tctex-type 1 [Monoraphidium neglectum]
MDDAASVPDETGFVADEVTAIVKEAVDGVLAAEAYNEQMVGRWTSNCLEGCVKRLVALGKPYKYIVTCTIMQKTGAGLHTAASAYYDTATDGSRTIRWENKSMYAITTVFALAA